MDQFFSPHNLKRYRRLASAELPALERNRILEALAEEWDAFRRECRGSAVGSSGRACKSTSHFETGIQHVDAGKGTRQDANIAMTFTH
jgi:hypothetical protein